MDFSTPDAAERLIKGLDNWVDDGVKGFVIECFTAVTEAASLTFPDSPAMSDAATLVTQETGSTVGAQYAPSAQERAWYYRGITDDGDQPELLYRTSSKESPWVPPAGRYADMPTKSVRPAYGTNLSKVWAMVGPKVSNLVHDTLKKSYSIDLARFFTVPPGEDGEEGTLGPAIVWLTVHPNSAAASVDTAHEVSQRILRLLAENGVTDAHVEWCKGVMTRLIGPALLPGGNRFDPTARFCRHLTAPLGIPIAPAVMERGDVQGSLGWFFHENKDKDGNPGDKVLAVTNHHVLCKVDDKLYDYRARGSPRQPVRVCGARRFQRGLDDIRTEVVNRSVDADDCAQEIARMEAFGDGADSEALEAARQQLKNHNTAIVKLESRHREFTVNWGDTALRNIGVLEYSPPISVGSNLYTEDIAIFRLDKAKFEPNFVGNQVDLGTTFSASELNALLNPRGDARTSFKYPPNGLLKIRGAVPKDRLVEPDTVDGDGQPCIVVMKGGCTTGLTVGRCAGFEAFTCDDNGVRSVEVAVYNYDKQRRPFAAQGDSGSLIFSGNGKDGTGKMVALLHSGKARSSTSATFVTYGAPAFRQLELIKGIYPNADFARETWL